MALAAADEMIDGFDYDRARALADIANVQGEAGDVEQARHSVAKALAAAEEVDDGEDRALALAHIAGVQAEAGEVMQAEQTLAQAFAAAKESFSQDTRASVLARIAIAQTEIGDVSGALAAASEIRDASARAGVLARIASALAEAGEEGPARQTFSKALAAANEVEPYENRANKNTIFVSIFINVTSKPLPKRGLNHDMCGFCTAGAVGCYPEYLGSA